MSSGCAHKQPPTPAYVAPPAGAATARLLMRGTLAPGDTYGVFVLGDDCTRPQRVGIGNAQKNPDGTRITSNGLSTLEVLVLKPSRDIYRVRLSFMPQAGHSYVVTAQSMATGARALVLDATQPDAMKLEPTLRRRDVTGNACLTWASSRPIKVATQDATSDGASDLPIPKARDESVPDDLSGLISR